MAGSVAAMKRRGRTVAVCTLIGGLGALLFFSVDIIAWGTVGVALVGITFISIGWPTFVAIGTEISGNSRVTAIGMLGTINQLGRVGGVALGGVVLAIGGFSAVGFFCLIVALLSAAVLQIGMNSNRPTY